MLSRTKIQIIVGIVAAVSLAITLLTGGTLSATPLKLYSGACATVTILLLSYERYLWRWRIVRRITGTPLVVRVGSLTGTVGAPELHPG